MHTLSTLFTALCDVTLWVLPGLYIVNTLTRISQPVHLHVPTVLLLHGYSCFSKTDSGHDPTAKLALHMLTAFKCSGAVGDQGAAASEMGQDAASAHMRSTMGPSTARPGRRRIKVSLLGGAWVGLMGKGGRGGGGVCMSGGSALSVCVRI